METITIKAFVVLNGEKVASGETDEFKPVNIADAIEVYGTEEKFLKLAWESHVIKIQASLRNGGDSKRITRKEADQLVAKIKADPDGELAQLAKRLGFSCT